MDFSVTELHKIEKYLNSAMDYILEATKIRTRHELNHSVLMKMNKDTLADFVSNLSTLMTDNIHLCKAAAGAIDQLKTEQLASQKTIIEQQEHQLNSVKKTVQTEMKTWSDIVKKNCETGAPSLHSVTKAVKSVVQADARSKNFLIFGASEEHGNGMDVAEKALDEILNDSRKPEIVSANRIGNQKLNKDKALPVKVTLASLEDVRMVLARASNLKKTTSTYYHTWYITPDRNVEERKAHQKLVIRLKEMITTEPKKYHYIRDGKILSVDKV